MTNRRGFSLIELMIVVSLVGILARFAVPQLLEIRLRARATSIINDLNVIRNAAFQAYGEDQVWPANAATGTIPDALLPFIPPNLTFAPEPGLSYDWRRSGIPGGNPAAALPGATMGMGVATSDLALRTEVQRQLANEEVLVTGGVVYWLIWGPTARP